MTAKQFYDMAGGDYEGTLARFLTEERMMRFALKFPADPSYNDLKTSLASGDKQGAFRAAHTLKGVCQNLGFSALYEPAHRVCEQLRAGENASQEDMFELEKLYAATIDAINLYTQDM